MWYVTVTTKNAGRVAEHTVRIPSDGLLELFSHDHFNWDTIFGFMEKGAKFRIKVHYTPGSKRIVQKDGLYFPTIDRIVVGYGHSDRGDAWNEEIGNNPEWTIMEEVNA